MNLFASLGGKLNYSDVLQIDGAFSAAHINYKKAPKFNGTDGRTLACDSRKESLSSAEHVDTVFEKIYIFNGVEHNLTHQDLLELWKYFWLEYVNAFDQLTSSLPESAATVFAGRHAIELGIKFILLKSTGEFPKTHNLGTLSGALFSKLPIGAGFMDGIEPFCKNYCSYIEGGNAEYFRFPQYRQDAYFAGNRLDIEWLSYNFALVLLKLIHFADLDEELKNMGDRS